MNQREPIAEQGGVPQQPAAVPGKKKWVDPQIIILAINEVTLGAAGINDDGGAFSS